MRYKVIVLSGVWKARKIPEEAVNHSLLANEALKN